MREFTIKWSVLSTVCMLIVTAGMATAQPSPDRLADRIIQKNSERLANVERIEITVEMEQGMIPASTTTYVKKTENGNVWLEPEGDDYDSEMATGLFDRQVPELIRKASSVTNENLGRYATYRVLIDDQQALQEMTEGDFEIDEIPGEMKQAIIWIDADELLARKIHFEQVDEQGNIMSVEIVMNDYQTHSGMPIAHRMEMKIEGLDSQFSEADIEEARRVIDEMEKHLSQIPASQRSMLEEQMRPQLDQYKAMLESGEMGKIVMKVTEVRVNP